MTYSVDFREKAIEFMDDGHTGKELYETLHIRSNEVMKWRRLLKETGSLEPRRRKTRPEKINLQKLRQVIEKKPDASLSDIAKEFNCTKQAVFYALKRLG